MVNKSDEYGVCTGCGGKIPMGISSHECKPSQQLPVPKKRKLIPKSFIKRCKKIQPSQQECKHCGGGEIGHYPNCPNGQPPKSSVIDSKFNKVYEHMQARCKYKSLESYKNYGGRGIKCEWKTFDEFKNDMYESYLEHVEKFGKKDTSIDRIDNDGNYNKKNCKWSTYIHQQNNKRTTNYIDIEGYKIPFSIMCRFLGVNDARERDRIRHVFLRGGNIYKDILTQQKTELSLRTAKIKYPCIRKTCTMKQSPHENHHVSKDYCCISCFRDKGHTSRCKRRNDLYQSLSSQQQKEVEERVRMEIREKYMDLLTSELRWCQKNKVKGITEGQRHWFMEGLIQAIILLQEPTSKRKWQEIKKAVLTSIEEKGGRG